MCIQPNNASGFELTIDLIQPLKRVKLWDIPHRYYCSILGTCLDIKEMKKISRKARLNLPPGATDYEIHSKFVYQAGATKSMAMYLNKYLDKKYQKDLKKCDAFSSQQELKEYWKQAKGNGDISSAYWVVLTHPFNTEVLTSHVFGDIHMLGHQLGSSLRADIKLLGELEAKCESMEETLRVTSERYKRDISQKNKTISRMESRLADYDLMVSELKKAQKRISFLEESSGLKKLAAEKADFFNKYTREKRRAENAEKRLAASNKKRLALQRSLEKLSEKHERTREELVRQELNVRECLNARPCPAATCPEGKKCPCPGVLGKKFLYVGGRTNLIRHYRSLIEEKGGHFLYHDGGSQESDSRLEELLNQVDAVFCPVDCVSHKASLRVKSTCKKRGKPFLMLRSSGLGALAGGLSKLSSEEICFH
jgi:hypothetical protein